MSTLQLWPVPRDQQGRVRHPSVLSTKDNCVSEYLPSSPGVSGPRAGGRRPKPLPPGEVGWAGHADL